jgi:succinyl-diaminopimelate desuccinylase
VKEVIAIISQKLEKAFALVGEKKEELIELLREIVGINTCVPPGKNYDTLVDFLEPRFKDLGFDTERVIVPEAKIREIPLPLEGSRVNLVATKRLGKEPVSIYAHMDTVPIEQKWSMDPFACTVEGDKIYGRGTLDMKGSIAALLIALRIMQELNLEPSYDLICLMCTDEEIGVYPGVYHLALQGYVKGHILSLELGSQDPGITIGAFGKLDVTVTTLGRSCHSGMNFLGVNAAEEMIPILEELMKLKVEVEKRESRIPAFPMPKAPSNKMTPMFNLNIIKGGVKSNIVPAECTLTIDRRYIVDENYEEVIAEIQGAIERGKKRSKALDVKVNYLHVYPAFEIDAESVYAKKMREAYKAVQNYKDEDFIRGGVYASTDMAFIAQELKTNKFACIGPFRRENLSAHGADEYVKISDLTSMIKELIYYLST